MGICLGKSPCRQFVLVRVRGCRWRERSVSVSGLGNRDTAVSRSLAMRHNEHGGQVRENGTSRTEPQLAVGPDQRCQSGQRAAAWTELGAFVAGACVVGFVERGCMGKGGLLGG